MTRGKSISNGCSLYAGWGYGGGSEAGGHVSDTLAGRNELIHRSLQPLKNPIGKGQLQAVGRYSPQLARTSPSTSPYINPFIGLARTLNKLSIRIIDLSRTKLLLHQIYSPERYQFLPQFHLHHLHSSTSYLLTPSSIADEGTRASGGTRATTNEKQGRGGKVKKQKR